MPTARDRSAQTLQHDKPAGEIQLGSLWVF
jgi:hypothetical protein